VADLLTIGTSGIITNKRSLAAVGNNIANVDTDGYSRQSVEKQQDIGSGNNNTIVGNGVIPLAVKRAYDDFATKSLRLSTASLEQKDQMVTYASKLEDIIGDKDLSLSYAFDRFFAAAQDLSVNPTSAGLRENLLNEAAFVATRFASIDKDLQSVDIDSFGDLESKIGKVNALTKEISDINYGLLKKSDVNRQPAGLLDQRDRLLQELSSYVKIEVDELPNGSVNVYLNDQSSGNLLVEDVSSFMVSVERVEDDPETISFVFDPYGKNPKLVSGLNAGAIAGIADFRSELLKPTRDKLDSLANIFVDAVNKVQTSGFDSTGEYGGALYAIGSDSTRDAGSMQVLLRSANDVATAAPLTVSLGDSFSEFKLDSWTGFEASLLKPGEVSVKQALKLDESTGTVSFLATEGQKPAFVIPANETKDFYLTTTQLEGVQVFTRDGVQVFGEEIPLADQKTYLTELNGFNADASYNTSYLNQGISTDAFMNAVTVSSDGKTMSIDGQLGQDLLVFFTQPGGSANFTGAWYEPSDTTTANQMLSEVQLSFISETQYVVKDLHTGTIVATKDYAFGDQISVNGWSGHLDRMPAVGDEFIIKRNTSLDGDNRNLLALTELQSSRELTSNKATLTELYADVINDVGLVVVQTSVSRDSQQVLVDEARQRRDSASAVSLDEEAADLLRFQQAYQASAQIMQTANKLFDAILNLR